jgi:hypothetical protein
MPRAPVPLAELTVARLAAVDEVRAFDPARPGFTAWFPVGGRSAPGDTLRVLDVAIDLGRRDEDLATLRAVTLAASREPVGGRTGKVSS